MWVINPERPDGAVNGRSALVAGGIKHQPTYDT